MFEDYLDTPHDSPIWFDNGSIKWNFKPHVEMLNDLSSKIEGLEKDNEVLMDSVHTLQHLAKEQQKQIDFIMENTKQDRIKTVDSFNVEDEFIKDLYK